MDIKENELSRTELLLGEESVAKLKSSNIIIFGVGGVGGYVAEALARTGIEKMTLVDKDVVSISNINRQIIALHSTVGRYKTEVMRDRIADINPEAKVTVYNIFYLKDTMDLIEIKEYDYVIDCVDTVTAKLLIIEEAKKAGVKVISSMGAGNKIEPTGFKAVDIYKTKVCPLARVMRRELKKRDIKNVKVVYSEEEPKVITSPPGSVAFVPSACGLVIASEVVKDICGI